MLKYFHYLLSGMLFTFWMDDKLIDGAERYDLNINISISINAFIPKFLKLNNKNRNPAETIWHFKSFFSRACQRISYPSGCNNSHQRRYLNWVVMVKITDRISFNIRYWILSDQIVKKLFKSALTELWQKQFSFQLPKQDLSLKYCQHVEAKDQVN